ncbi:GNAT family N-acetyltransferase [Micromonospora krabiensis]|uniref:Acetyltransferase (GNAT) family protein n=1 Tax=Micromonospora krabiensis TaxID=307121 RepID=A0A1C3NCQ8_9ACTN|nr:GNAT family N-acetyltransferase [Micromonospora krabiensis]SBV30330.1 Acetyltransferase (GNAT) family protein [Micromonospora krabiensis]
MGLVLDPMTADEWARLRGPLEESYAEEVARHRGYPPDAARDLAATQIAGLLPDGVATAGVLLRVARVDDVQVGWIWVTLPGPGEASPGRAWIHNIEVDPAHRGRGHARRMIQLMEAELAARGVPELGLNVFGSNTVAIGLYESLGFRVAAQQMVKPLPRPEPAP